MALATTYSLTDNNAVSHDFESHGGANGNQHLFLADSPALDLAGRLSLRVSHETTKSAVIRSLFQFRIPILDTITGLYPSYDQFSGVLVRSTIRPLQESLDSVVLSKNLLSGFFPGPFAEGDL